MNGYPCFMDISLQLSMLYGYPFGYPWISMYIHALTCCGFSIHGLEVVCDIQSLSRYTDPSSRAILQNPFLHFKRMWYLPGRDRSDSAAPPTTSTAARPPPGVLRTLRMARDDDDIPPGQTHIQSPPPSHIDTGTPVLANLPRP